jgi:hypothetical protein
VRSTSRAPASARCSGAGSPTAHPAQGAGEPSPTSRRTPEPEGEPIEIEQRTSTSFREIASTVFGRYPRRAWLAFALLATQAFLYNAVLFSSTLILTSQFDVSDSSAPAYLIPWALANFAGALLLGRLFDTVGRRIMITARYAASAAGASCWGRR